MALTTNVSISPPHELRRMNRMIKRKLVDGNMRETITTYVEMQEEMGLFPDNFTFPILIKAASALPSLPIGSLLHAQTLKSGYYSHPFVQTALLNMYSALGHIQNARRLFDEMSNRDIVAWNSILNAYADRGLMDECVQLFDSMPLKDRVSNNIIISGFATIGRLDDAKRAFDASPPGKDAFTWNSMISAYVRADDGDMDSARALLDRMPEKDTVSWNTVAAGYLKAERYDDVLRLFFEMIQMIEPNHLTISCAISACAHLCSLRIGRMIHIYAVETGLSSSPHVATALIDMYAKCGSIEGALEVFYKTQDKDIYCWNSMISGLAFHGFGRAPLRLFEGMQMRPDDITFIGVLTACSHAGLVSEGCGVLEGMEREHGVSPKSEHYGCVVDMLCRAGRAEMALEVVKGMSFEPGATVLGALLGGCVNGVDVEMGEAVAKRMMSDEGCVMMGNMYGRMGRWEDARRWREMMVGGGKRAGWSMIEVGGKVYRFLAGDPKYDFLQ